MPEALGKKEKERGFKVSFGLFSLIISGVAVNLLVWQWIVVDVDHKKKRKQENRLKNEE